jgi:hypothetical protein
MMVHVCPPPQTSMHSSCVALVQESLTEVSLTEASSGHTVWSSAIVYCSYPATSHQLCIHISLDRYTSLTSNQLKPWGIIIYHQSQWWWFMSVPSPQTSMHSLLCCSRTGVVNRSFFWAYFGLVIPIVFMSVLWFVCTNNVDQSIFVTCRRLLGIIIYHQPQWWWFMSAPLHRYPCTLPVLLSYRSR